MREAKRMLEAVNLPGFSTVISKILFIHPIFSSRNVKNGRWQILWAKSRGNTSGPHSIGFGISTRQWLHAGPGCSYRNCKKFYWKDIKPISSVPGEPR
jgi:hypothetical protein